MTAWYGEADHCGFEIKREEKYFVFIWMSRKEQLIDKKMGKQGEKVEKCCLGQSNNSSGPKTISIEVEDKRWPEEQNQCQPEIFTVLAAKLSRKDIPQDNKEQTAINK